MSKDNTVVNPFRALQAFFVAEVANLESKGKNPKSIKAALEIIVEKIVPTSNAFVEARKELRSYLQERVAFFESEGKNPRVFAQGLELLANLNDVNYKMIAELQSKLGVAEAANDALLERAEALEAAFASEPKKNVLVLTRPQIEFLIGAEGSDEFPVTSSPEEVLTRIFPVVHHSLGHLGFAVLMAHDARHLVYFTKVTAQLEVARGETLDIDNPNDALLVYQHTASIAVRFADIYTQTFGPLNKVVAESKSANDPYDSDDESVSDDAVEGTSGNAVPGFMANETGESDTEGGSVDIASSDEEDDNPDDIEE